MRERNRREFHEAWGQNTNEVVTDCTSEANATMPEQNLVLWYKKDTTKKQCIAQHRALLRLRGNCRGLHRTRSGLKQSGQSIFRAAHIPAAPRALCATTCALQFVRDTGPEKFKLSVGVWAMRF
ncbi:hypothetical protein B5X24_HaOG207112 [Helicoverpa armigera]|uniref:Uncharacterized protein n=1 Tax=Helicoverpa armigera TaxID=29058 RepID=A0A2W1BJ15_HELAM|nr:hypothetical protein B5X24_HaOG207112 [Helicoverpa armigera]